MTWWRLQSKLCSVKATGIWRICNGLGIMSYKRKTPLTTAQGNLNGVRYQDEILDVIVRPHFQQFQAERPIFMDDNACPHRIRLVDAYTVQHNIDSLQWTSMSPDLNPIEHVWNAIQKVVNARQPLWPLYKSWTWPCIKSGTRCPNKHVAILFNRWVGSARQSHRLAEDIPTTDAPVTLQWTLWWKLPWAKWYFVMQPLCYHICFHLRISFSGRHRNEFKLFLLSKMGIFSCFVSYALLLNKSFTTVMCWCILFYQSIVVVAMWTSFLRESKFSQFLFPKMLVPSKLQICKTFAQVCTSSFST